MTAINLDKWNSLDSETQDLITREIKTKFEEPAWASAQGSLANDVACLTGKGACKSGEAHSMTLVEPTKADLARAREILETKVLPEWADRAGADWAKRWNDSVGKVVDVSVPVKK